MGQDIGDHEVGICRTYVADKVILGAFGQRVAGIVDMLETLGVVPFNGAGDDGAEENAGVGVPAGMAAWGIHDVLHNHVCGTAGG